MALLKVDRLKVYYPIKGGLLGRIVENVRAVDDVSFEIKEGTTYGLVGESGSGKSTVAKAIMRLVNIKSGNIFFEGKDIANSRGKALKEMRRDVQMIFQDPFSSLNPKKCVRDIIAEPLRNFYRLSKPEEQERVAYFLEKVGLSPDVMYKYPHQFSGGQRQRIGIARALTLKPRLIVADEPVSSLDVSVQAQVLNFLKELQEEFKLTYLLIGHDLGVIHHMCGRVGVMYRGQMVEEGNAQDILSNPIHIYTKLLVSSIPDSRPENRDANKKLREKVKSEYETGYYKFFDANNRAYDLKQISETRRAALLESEGR